ncbi:tripartite tricarboxylate transporter substrate binding protein [Siccirubricoccus sp. KC 17139]|uniref:Tripartite tricarboxylate transporter substrate binding protein n=1 Tax=Siccirubricoccus soli TaxID=2899147 RepID=A0ABT1D151_9PROT|nr:tripartite tricarboxylate transporter substrate-binding protein [Siccirubricoccus soli]MCO6415640.1 tripartite tricarboxylate transporter substrate binding protein [Siccirubricoccus soli]MCP2681772.1 tripartite tricarboxylate transporter substrate-binding protein [Siccirubricoccus soli]
MHRREWLAATLALPGLAMPALAQPHWPSRPLRFIVPFAAGGPVEIPARFLAEALAPVLGQSVVVETRGGAGGAVGTQAVIASQDAHTFLFTTGAIAIQPALQPEIGYDPQKDLLPISLISEAPMGFAARPNGRVKDLAGLIALAKAQPGAITIGSSGNGTTTHMLSALFALRAGIEWTHVPYRGGGQMVGAFLGGDIDLMSVDLATGMPHVKEGRAVFIGQSGTARSPVLPEVPCLQEMVPGAALSIWFALLGPKGTPPEVAQKLAGALEGFRSSALAGRMAENGAALLLAGPETLAARLNMELPMWRQVVAQAGLKAE